jgi:hypothetical protein
VTYDVHTIQIVECLFSGIDDGVLVSNLPLQSEREFQLPGLDQDASAYPCIVEQNANFPVFSLNLSG